MVGTDLTVGIRRRHAAAIGRPIKADDGRRDLHPAELGLNDGIRFETKVEIARHDVPVFVLAQGTRSRRYGCDIAQGGRDIKMHHRRQAAILAYSGRLNGRLRLGGPAWRQGKPEQRQGDANQATSKTNQDGPIKEGGSISRFSFHERFFLSVFGSVRDVFLMKCQNAIALTVFPARGSAPAGVPLERKCCNWVV